MGVAGNTHQRPRAAVVGLGRYYHKLHRGLLEQFDLVGLIDSYGAITPRGWLHDAVVATNPDAILLLTPNALHASQVVELAPLRRPVFVEKPLATTSDSLDSVRRSLETNPRLYCSDFYPDVRAIPMRTWLRREPPWAGEAVRVRGDLDLWRRSLDALGRLRRVEAVLREGEGDAAGFEGRDWLWDPTHGGVLWDLAYHYLTLWHEALAEPLTLQHVDLGVIGDASSDPVSETAAMLQLASASGVEVSIAVQKYYAGENERWFRLLGDAGQAVLTFAEVNSLTVEVGGDSCVAELAVDYYPAVACAFRWFVDATPTGPHGFNAATMAIGIILQAKHRPPPRRIARGDRFV